MWDRLFGCFEETSAALVDKSRGPHAIVNSWCTYSCGLALLDENESKLAGFTKRKNVHERKEQVGIAKSLLYSYQEKRITKDSQQTVCRTMQKNGSRTREYHGVKSSGNRARERCSRNKSSSAQRCRQCLLLRTRSVGRVLGATAVPTGGRRGRRE